MVSSREQIQAGKDWVTETFKRLAHEFHIEIGVLNWRVSSDDFDKGEHSLEFYAGDQRRVVKFSDEKLMNCPNDKNKSVRAELESRIRHIVRSPTAPEKKIGF